MVFNNQEIIIYVYKRTSYYLYTFNFDSMLTLSNIVNYKRGYIILNKHLGIINSFVHIYKALKSAVFIRYCFV